MPDETQVRRELMSVMAACLAEEATARDFLAFATPHALDDGLEDGLRGDLDRLSVVADEVERFGLGEDVFLEVVHEVCRRYPNMEFASAAD